MQVETTQHSRHFAQRAIAAIESDSNATRGRFDTYLQDEEGLSLLVT